MQILKIQERNPQSQQSIDQHRGQGRYETRRRDQDHSGRQIQGQQHEQLHSREGNDLHERVHAPKRCRKDSSGEVTRIHAAQKDHIQKALLRKDQVDGSGTEHDKRVNVNAKQKSR